MHSLISRLLYRYTSVGAHKVHPQWVTWNTARRNCESEGAYLAIINSVVEADAIVRLFGPSNVQKVFVGLHDLYHEEEFVTIHGESIGETGFNRWQDGEPNNGAKHDQHCVVLNDDGKYDDIQCAIRLPYVCELRDVSSEVRTVSPSLQQMTPNTEESEEGSGFSFTFADLE